VRGELSRHPLRVYDETATRRDLMILFGLRRGYLKGNYMEDDWISTFLVKDLRNPP